MKIDYRDRHGTVWRKPETGTLAPFFCLPGPPPPSVTIIGVGVTWRRTEGKNWTTTIWPLLPPPPASV